MEVLNDFNTSVERALSEIDPNWKEYRGLILCGTHTPHDWEEQILKIQRAREKGLPFLGICFGHQLAAIEYARNVLGQKNATSQEFYGEFHHSYMTDCVVVKRKDGLKVGLHDGESYWNNYEVIEGFESMWKKADSQLTVQYHPEYQSSIDKPHPILVKFLDYARNTSR
jgi:CTP synthase (UTP-ammonia lyase)